MTARHLALGTRESLLAEVAAYQTAQAELPSSPDCPVHGPGCEAWA